MKCEWDLYISCIKYQTAFFTSNKTKNIPILRRSITSIEVMLEGKPYHLSSMSRRNQDSIPHSERKTFIFCYCFPFVSTSVHGYCFEYLFNYHGCTFRRSNDMEGGIYSDSCRSLFHSLGSVVYRGPWVQFRAPPIKHLDEYWDGFCAQKRVAHFWCINQHQSQKRE